jgi:hypothetical protein
MSEIEAVVEAAVYVDDLESPEEFYKPLPGPGCVKGSWSAPRTATGD